MVVSVYCVAPVEHLSFGVTPSCCSFLLCQAGAHPLLCLVLWEARLRFTKSYWVLEGMGVNSTVSDTNTLSVLRHVMPAGGVQRAWWDQQLPALASPVPASASVSAPLYCSPFLFQGRVSPFFTVTPSATVTSDYPRQTRAVWTGAMPAQQ